MTKIHQFNQNQFINLKGRLYDLSIPRIMGIINVTQDSFFSESRKTSEKEILESVENMLNNGADIIDIGGVSTRPNASIPSIEEEINRILKPIQSIKKYFPQAIISLDTMRGEVAQIGIEEGIDIINDVSGGMYDESIVYVVAKSKVPYILTHSNGNEINKVPLDSERNITTEIISYFSNRIQDLKKVGINDIIIDPGFGFDKSISENYELVKNFEMLHLLEKPILVGISRKSMIYNKLKINPEDSLNGTTVLNSVLLMKNASVFRVHDVKEMNEVKELLQACK
jgi:dihydropteroate synthase